MIGHRGALDRTIGPWPLVMMLLACAHVPRARTPDRASRTSVEWTAYAHDQEGTKYSPADQITRANVQQLAPAWTYRTGDFGLGGGMARDETTPLYVDGVLYVSTPYGGVRALDGETGHELWSFDADLDVSSQYGDFANRGVSTWLDTASPANTPCHRTIYMGTVDARLIALDAASGEPCAAFGDGGVVDLAHGLRNTPEFKGEYGVTSAPVVVSNLVIVGTTVHDGRRAKAPSGVVRAFDARTGRMVWGWDPVPRDSSQPGYDTWNGPIAHETGAANAWAPMSVDSARDLLFVPTGSASPDFFGGERLGQNLYANSVVALRASTGALVWAFQVVHHDLWDYDAPAQPVLFTLHRDGAAIAAVAEPTKMGHLFILDRETGKPLFPVEERAVPRSDVPGEQAWPTQPFPVRPAPLVPSRFTAADIFALSDSGRAWCEAQLAGARSDGIFTPPSLHGTVIYPGNVGGSNWSGMAIDPTRHLAILPLNRLVTVAGLIPRAELHDRLMGGTRFDEIAPQAGTPYAMHRRHLIGPDGVPCNPPPWGTLTAVDLDTGDKLWERPLGSVPYLARFPGSASWGSPSLGGGMITAGGMIFVGGTLDQRLHAYDVGNGAELWSAELPAGLHAAPMTYITPSGRQFIVVAAGGHKELRDRAGDYVIAFALPDSTARTPMAPQLSSGHYDGHMVLDATRLDARWALTIHDSAATLSVQATTLGVRGQGTGRIVGDSLVADVRWTSSELHCSGTMRLHGAAANENRAIIGELTYVDACTDGSTKPGTFAMWKEGRHETHIHPTSTQGDGTTTSPSDSRLSRSE
ncbi:MAG TPA: pyrroloquinoline quinone-dependent dehydrogenase [Gemmatimonadaceae bacterium]